MLSILWSYGGKVMEADGTTIALNSKETAESIEYVKVLYNETMEPEVLSWDNAGNNRFMIAGKGSWIQNPSSHYITAKTSKLPVADANLFPSDPCRPTRTPYGGESPQHGRVEILQSRWTSAKTSSAICSMRNAISTTLRQATTTIIPSFTKFETHPVWNIDPKYEPFKTIGQYSHLYTWPAAPIRRRKSLFTTTSSPICTPRRLQERLPKMRLPGLREKLNASTKRASREEKGGWRCCRS